MYLCLVRVFFNYSIDVNVMFNLCEVVSVPPSGKLMNLILWEREGLFMLLSHVSNSFTEVRLSIIVCASASCKLMDFESISSLSSKLSSH